MSAGSKLYVDSDGVKRGYYVYVHKDRATGAVFYVGKGSGKRAWDASKRSQAWIDRTALLADGWEVEIVAEDLSELEAFGLEAELVTKYGGAKYEDGTLANLVPGGEATLSARLKISFNDGGWSQAYSAARRFLDLTRDKQEAFANNLVVNLDKVLDNIERLQNENEDRSNDGSWADTPSRLDPLDGLECIVGSFRDTATEFLRHRVSWKELGIELEEAVDDLESEEENQNFQGKATELLKIAQQTLKVALDAIDSGNRSEAEVYADRALGKQ
jgi:hypothetical protein